VPVYIDVPVVTNTVVEKFTEVPVEKIVIQVCLID
jgi:hypothetical protein